MTWVWAILCLLVTFCCSLYWYMKRPENYLEELGIPYIRNSTFTILAFFFKTIVTRTSDELHLHNFEIDKYKKYGRIYGSKENGFPIITISDPDLLRKVLVKDFHIFTNRRDLSFGDPIGDNFLSVLKGETWKRVRTIVSPAFSTGKIKRVTDIIIDCAKTLEKNLASEATGTIEGKKFFNSFTIDVIASSAFGTKIYSYQDPNNRFVQEASKFFGGKFTWKLVLLILFPKLASALGIRLFDSKMMNFFRDTTLQIIEDRRKTGMIKNDFLQLLIDAEKEHEKENATSENTKEEVEEEITELGHDEENAKIFKPTRKYKSLSQSELIAQCTIFFLAGFDTTASTLTCVFHELAVNPDIQDKLREEIDTVISNNNNQLTYASIQEMKYLDHFLSEVLRMYPPIFRIERLAEEDYELEGTGVTVKKGTIVAAPVHAIHHDPEFYPEPEKFRPERFTSEEKQSRHPYSYLTFGAGPRNCVGMRFALMEIKLCIAYLLSHLVFKKCSQTQIPLKLRSPMGLLKPDAFFAVEKRKNIILENGS